MIIDMISSSSFAPTLEYIAARESAEIDKESCQGIIFKHDKNELIKTNASLLTATAKRSQRVKKPVTHISINPHPDDWDKIKDQIPELIKDITKSLGLCRCQRLTAIHDDTKTPNGEKRKHIHVAYNSIPYKGSNTAILASLNWRRNREKTLDFINQKYNLSHKPQIPDRRIHTTGQEKRIREEEEEYLKGIRTEPPQKSAIETTQDLIEKAIESTDNLTDYLNFLEKNGCKSRITTRKNTILGISYENENITLKGSYLGRNEKSCTLQGIAKRGININIERDSAAIAKRAYDKTNPQRQVSAEEIAKELENLKLESKQQLIKQPEVESAKMRVREACRTAYRPKEQIEL